MKKLKKGILLALSTMILGGAIIGVGSQTANSSEQLARVHRAVSSEVTTSETTSSSSGTETQELKRVQVGDELAGKTIWFNPFLIFNRITFSSLIYGQINIIDFDITGELRLNSTPPGNEGELSGFSFSKLSYMGYQPLQLPFYNVGQEGGRYYSRGIGFFEEKIRFGSEYQANLNNMNFNDWYSITFYDKDTFKIPVDDHFNVTIPDLSIKVKSFSDEINSLFFYELPKNIIKYKEINTIYKQKNAILTVDDVIKKIDFKGYKDLKIIKDEYSGNGNKCGQYDVIFEYTDDIGKDTFRTNIVVVDSNLPTAVWTFKETDVYDDRTRRHELVVDTNERLKISKDDLINILSYVNNVSDELVIYTFTDTNNVLDQTDKKGTYNLSCVQKSSLGTNPIETNITLNIADKDSGTIVDKRLNVWQKVCRFFSNVFNNIKNFFVWLYDHTIGAIVKFFQKKD